MSQLVSLAKSRPFWMTIQAAVGALGLTLLIDGLLHGEPRHQAVAILFGIVLMLPIVLIALFGERALRICNRLALSVTALALFIVCLEVAARALDLSVFTYPEVVSDPIYGHAHVPGRGGLDAWGYRNAHVPQSADSVCIGDSQTFGTNIRREDNYASELARASGREVYNMSLGGYGPLQYVELAKRSLDLRPKTVVIGYYFGNDLADAHRFLGLEHWSGLRAPELAYTLPNDVDYGDKRSLNLAMAATDGLMLHSLVLRKIGNDLKLAAKLSPLLRGFVTSDNGGIGYEGGAISTRFQPKYRMGCMNLAVPQMRDGLRITGHCFRELSAIFEEANARPVLLLIHNKEFYYHELMGQRGETVPSSIASLAEMERTLMAKITELAAEAGMDVVDPTAQLVAALGDGVAVYPSDVDAHLNRAGSAIVGRALAQAIETP